MRISKVLITSIFVLVVLRIEADSTTDLLSLGSGAVMLSYSDEHSTDWKAEWSAIALLDDTGAMGWASRRSAAFPHWFVVELAALSRLESVTLDNRGVQEREYPGISARRVVVKASRSGPDRNLAPIAEIEVPRNGVTTFDFEEPVEARWLRIEIVSNWGNSDWTELMELTAMGELIEPVEAEELTGVFDTSYGPTAIRVNGSAASGCYDGGKSRLFGDISGRASRLEWRNESDRGAGESGAAILVAGDEGRRLNGLWYGRGEYADLVGRWWGERVDGSPADVCEEAGLLDAIESLGRATLYGIHFEVDSDRMEPDAEPALRSVLAAMGRNADLVLAIVGHTDSTASSEYNLDLSRRRAGAVKAWLSENGIVSGRLSAEGRGESEPVADNGTAHGRELNRRVEVVVKPTPEME